MRDENRKGNNTQPASKGGDSSPSTDFDRIQPVQAKPLEVKVSGNNFEKALKAFRAIAQKERILSVYKEKQSFEKPSDKKRRKKNESKRKIFEQTLKDKRKPSDRKSRRSEEK